MAICGSTRRRPTPQPLLPTDIRMDNSTDANQDAQGSPLPPQAELGAAR